MPAARSSTEASSLSQYEGSPRASQTWYRSRVTPIQTGSLTLTDRTGTPALETGRHGFVQGFLYTTRDALFAPKSFYAQLSDGALRMPFAFAVVSLALPLLVADFGGYLLGISGQSQALTVSSLLRSLLAPLIAAAGLPVVQGLLWSATTRLFGARVPLRISLRAMAYLSSIAASFGVVMTVAGFAPESAFCVILWYGTLNVAYLFATYACYALARGPYGFGRVKAGFAVWVYQVGCGILGVLLVALYSALQNVF